MSRYFEPAGDRERGSALVKDKGCLGCHTVHGAGGKLAGIGGREMRFADSAATGVEIDRCATDAIQALTGVSLGKRTLKHLDFGKMAATFVDVPTGAAVRVSARDDARSQAHLWAPGLEEPRRAQIVGYRAMPESLLLVIQPVAIEPGWLDRKRVRVPCAACGEGVNYERQVQVGARDLCRACAGERYYRIRT